MVALYAVTLFASALLLFLVQPMVGKMVLPKLGGTPAVWNTCMVFFQAMLLAGYAYAHGTAARFSVRRQAIVHLLLLFVPLVVLPISVAANSAPPSTDGPIGWLLWQLLLGVGLPFFVLSSTAPLLQKWFSHSGHGEARDPYFLYAASNTGSLLALLSYPLLVEPHLRLAEQSWLWATGYGVLAGLALVCAIVAMRSSSTPRLETGEIAPAPERNSMTTGESTNAMRASRLRERLWWILLSAIPSSLMLGVTTYTTTDLAAIPLMWVVPLTIYLLTFVLVFARRPRISHAFMVKLLPFLLLPMGFFFVARLGHMEWLIIPAHLVTFFVATMICHGELVRRRPAAERLTEFYLLMSVGGVIGGIFNTIVAPNVFTGVFEYPLVLILVCFVLPKLSSHSNAQREQRLDWILPAIMAGLSASALGILHATSLDRAGPPLTVTFALMVLACFTFKNRPVRLGLSYAVMIITLTVMSDLRTGDILHAERNFFGVKRVVYEPNTQLRMLVHGTTRHGCQKVDPSNPTKTAEPSAYYHCTGPAGDVFSMLNARPRHDSRVGVIGLGVGAVAAYALPGQRFTFYEIDPAVERIARDPRYFSFLSQCRAQCEVVLGDGRLTVAKVPDGTFDLLMLDAFSSDAIPTHLLAREALELYLSKLTDDGLLVFHISNRFFNLEELLARSAEEMGLVCMSRYDGTVNVKQATDGKLASHYFVMARRNKDLSQLSTRTGWYAPVGRPSIRTWTDQYCDVFSVFRTGKQINLGPRTAAAKQ